MSQCCSSLCDATAAQFDPERAASDLADYRANGPGRTTRKLLDGLAATGVQPRSLLDIGGGIGTLSLELLDRGVASATCVDMSPAFVECGREEAARRGFEQRMSWRTADFVTVAAEIPRADLVTLDRVVCCYPAFDSLLQRAADHAELLLAMAYPKSVWYVRALLGAENVRRRLQGNSFRSYVHSPAKMDELLRGAGFQRLSSTSTIMWRMDVYRRVVG